jgi:uncharacterized repeat protein (TIGR01451 family)
MSTIVCNNSTAGMKYGMARGDIRREMFKHKQHAHLLGRDRGPTFLLIYIAVLLLFLTPTPAAAQPTGYQEYYVLGYEEQVWQTFLAIYDGPDRDIPGWICSTVSLVATADYQVIYYDHWEDGYEADLLNPVQATTEIYGDSDTSNGGTGNDILLAGDDINLTSTQGTGGSTDITASVPVSPSRNRAYIRYDGSDRVIASGGPVNLTHAMWPLNRSWAGGAWEVYSRQAYADAYSYRLPIGEDLYDFGGGDNGTYGDFRNVYLQLGAFEDNTIVSINNGTNVIDLTLDQGQTYSSMGYINSTSAPSISINAGTTIRSNKPIQAGLVTGADNTAYTFQGRFLTMLPNQLWGADYIVPVPSGNLHNRAEVYLYNPNDFPITVHGYDIETQTSFAISPTAHISATVPYSQKRGGYVPADSAVRFTSSDGVFGVVVCADTSEVAYDWGFSGTPSKYLSRDYYASWAPGSYNTPPTENGSPVWVTPLADGTTFYVDFNKDPDGLDGIVDETFTLDVLEQRRIFDPDNDNTGMHVWATGEFAIAWGEDPRTAGRSNPYLDMGVSMLPLLQRWVDPVLTLDKTASPTILPPAGGAVTFTLAAQAHNAPLVNVDITDTLPINWAYVPNSTHVAYPDGSSGNPDPMVNGQTLFWDLSTNLAPHQILTLTFQARVTTAGSVGTTAYEGFESGGYSGGKNWTGSWQEGGDDGLPGSGDVAIVYTNPSAGSYSLHIRNNNNTVARTIDLSDFSLPVLRFMRMVDSLEGGAGEEFYLEIYDGSSWTRVLTWVSGDQEGAYVQETVDLSPYASADTEIRFGSGSGTGSWDIFYADQIEVYDAIAVNINRGEAIGKHAYADALFNPYDDATVYVSPLNLVKSVSSAEARTGDTLVYTLSYTNTSSSTTLTNVMLREVVPIQYVSFRSTSDGGSYDGTSGTVTWALDTLAPRASGTATFTVAVNDFVENGTVVENIAYVASDQTVEASSNVVRTTVLAPDVKLNKAGPTVAARGQVITYTLSYENIGRAQATGVVIQDTIPMSTTYVPGSLAINTGSGWVTLTDAADSDQGAYISPTLTITPGALAAGEAGQIRFSVQVEGDSPPGSLILNSATLDRDLDIPRDSNLVVTRISDLLINKAAEQAIVAPGGVISYTLSYENASETTAQTDVYVREPIPDHTDFISITGSGGNQVEYSWDNGLTWLTTLPVTPVTHIRWHDAEVPANTQVTVGFAVQVTATWPPNTSIQNVAHITSTENAAYFHKWIPSNQVEVAMTACSFATISGTVFRDDDGDGARDIGEPGIPDVFITLDRAITTTTDVNGNYIFSTTVPGVHTVIETDLTIYNPIIMSPADPPGYFSTTPNEVQVDVILGNSYRVDFGDMLTDSGFASIYGTVFNDADGDGVRDMGELGISGVLVALDGVSTSTTDLKGNYVFSTTVAGAHVVRETDPVGYSSTTPNEVHVDVILGNGYQVEFGDAPTNPNLAYIYGTVFNDADSNGVQDGSETGISGVTVTLDENAAVTTGLYGGYTFVITAAGAHIVRETDPDGYSSTTPNEMHVDVTLGNSYRRDFGDISLEPHVCDGDIYEEDDTAVQATWFIVGASQAHQFCDDAVDWVKFEARADIIYTITTFSWGQRADTFLALFDTNVHTRLAANDDYEGATDHSSRIIWQAPTNGVYYVRITNQGGMTGTHTDYDLLIEGTEPLTIYLPLVAQNHSDRGSTSMVAPVTNTKPKR